MKLYSKKMNYSAEGTYYGHEIRVPFMIYSFMKSIGQIQERNPWTLQSWDLGPISLSHYENFKHTPGTSGPSLKHSWKVIIRNSTLEFIVHWGKIGLKDKVWY